MNDTQHILYNGSPASDWAEAYPIGNGRIGAMVYGNPTTEHVALNHDLLWRCYRQPASYHAAPDMPAVKALCREKKWAEANAVLGRHLPISGQAIYINPFVPACDLFVKMHLPESAVSDYSRSLDMRHGIADCTFKANGNTFTRQSFTPVGENLFIMRLSASVPGILTGEVSVSRMPDVECNVIAGVQFGLLQLEGCFDEGRKFSVSVRVLHRNGRLVLGKRTYGLPEEEPPERHFGLGYVFDRDTANEPERGVSLFFDACDEVTILVSVTVDVEEKKNFCGECNGVSVPDFESILLKHKQAFSAYFDRQRLSLTEIPDNRPMEKRIAEAEKEDRMSPALMEILYNFARYVAISSGMPQKPGEYIKAPINLQGLWNRDTRPAWESDYHLDLNIEMCYWPLAEGGFPEFGEVLLSWIERLLPQAEALAQDLYGVNGACYNGCCDPWTLGSTDLLGVGTLSGGAWLMQILWIFYEYNPSADFLRRMFALMKPITKFYEEMLTEEEGGYKTFSFGASPEMGICLDGKTQWLGAPSACDLSLTKELFTHAAAASRLLGEAQTAEYFEKTASQIRPMPVDASGRLMEWTYPHVEEDPGHRHRSPFICFCPGTSVTKRNAPELTAAAEKLLDYRLSQGNDASTSFSYSWDAQILARLGRGEEAMNTLFNLVRFHLLPNLLMTTNNYAGKGGIAWFPGVKVMQIEAELGLISAFREMILQDTDGVISLLPALPSVLPEGSFCGLNTRGGFTVDLFWKNGRPETVNITSEQGGLCHVEWQDISLKLKKLPEKAVCGQNRVAFYIGKGMRCRLEFDTDLKQK